MEDALDHMCGGAFHESQGPKALDLIIELDYYSRYLPVVHELFVRLRRCCSGGYESGQRGASRTWRKGQDAEASTSGQASVGAIYRAHTHASKSSAEPGPGGAVSSEDGQESE